MNWSKRTALNFLALGLLTDAAALHASISSKQFLSDAGKLKTTTSVRLLDLDNKALELRLRPVEVFSADASIIVMTADGKEQHLPIPKTHFFVIDGNPSANGLIAVYADNQVEGLVQIDGQNRRVIADQGDLKLAQLKSPEPAAKPFQCANDAIGAAGQRSINTTGSAPTLPLNPNVVLATRTARIAIDTDEELLTRFGGNATTATNYIANLIGYISTIYDAQVQTNMQVSFVRFWTPGTDPWVQTTPECLMLETGRYWNNNQSATSRTVTHFLSGKTTTAGIAWVGVLCSGAFSVSPSQIGASCPGLDGATVSNYGGGYGVTSGIAGNFNPASPTVVWDVLSVAHELGHNFDSPHTHCYGGIGGNASPIDQCYAAETGTGCFSGATSLPGAAGSGSGTIMSYCHLISPGLSNSTLTLGAGFAFGVQPGRVPTQMSAHVQAAATSNPSCLALQGSGPNIFKNGFE
jgi:hypothetical protein